MKARLQKYMDVNWLVSTYVVCERLSVMHEPAGVVENLVQILQNTPILKYRIPPLPKMKLSEILALWLFSSRIPPHPRKLKFRQIMALCDFSVPEHPLPTPPPPKLKFRQIMVLCDFSVPEYPPPPDNWNLGRSWHFVTFQVPEYPPPPNWNLGRSWHFVTFQFQNTPPPLKFRQIMALCDFSVPEYPPPRNWKLIFMADLGTLTFHFQNTPFPPPQIFWMGNYVWQVTTCGDFIQPG